MEYTTIIKPISGLQLFDDEITDYLNNGYHLIGSVQIAKMEESIFLVQCLVKDDNQEKEDFYFS
jgi:hypothetical protein